MASQGRPNKRKRPHAEDAEEGDGLDGGTFSLEGGAPDLELDDGMGAWHSSPYAAVAPINADTVPDAPTTEKLREAANEAHDTAVAGYEAGKAGAKESSDAKWMQTVLRSGTTSDKVAAMTLLVQESPMHNLGSLQKLLDLAGKKGGAREGRTMACDALKDLMLQNLLPERKLRWFAQQPLGDLPDDEGDPERVARLRFWFFEDALKRSYIDFLAILERDLGDTVSKFKLKAMHTVADLLKTKAENEKILLTLLANKIGDIDNRVGSRAVHLLQTLVFEHSAMKAVVAREIENIAFRPNVGLRTQYYAVIFLSNLTLLRDTDNALAARLIGAYFGLFEQMVRGAGPSSDKDSKGAKGGKDKEADASVQSRLMSALLTGVNRAFPYARDEMDSETTGRHVEALYRLVHAKDSATGGVHINVSIQSLQLLQQLQSKDSALSDRFYRSLYQLISLPELRACRKQAMLLNLLYKAMLRDEDEGRLRAFVKRILQNCSYHHPPFICGSLFMLSEIAKTKRSLKQWIASAPVFEPPAPEPVPQVEDAEEQETDEGTSDAGARGSKRKKAKKGKGKADTEGDDIQINQRKPQQKKAVDTDADAEAASTQPQPGEGEGERKQVEKYDPKKREPLHAGAHNSLPWELVGLGLHFHPTVRTFSAELRAGNTIVYGGDPLADHSLLAFLDRFQFKKPKAPKKNTEATAYSTHAARGRLAERGVQLGVGKGLGVVNTEAFARLSESEVPPKDLFFHHFFSRQAVQRDAAQRRKVRDAKAEAKAAKDAESEATKAAGGSAAAAAVRGFGEDSSDEEGLDDGGGLAPARYDIDDMQVDVDGDASADDDEFGFDDNDDDSDEFSSDDDDDDGGGGGGGMASGLSAAFADADDFAALIANDDSGGGSAKGAKKQEAWESRTDDNANKGGKRPSQSRPGRKGKGSRAKSKGGRR